ncbi:MAG: cytochrome P450 [Acidimicrobiales bacterium]
MAANANPQAIYKLMRDNVPVMEDTSTGVPSTVVALHADIWALLHDPKVFSSSYDAVHIGQIRPLIPLQIDPPRHAIYRRLLDPLFAPRRVAPLEARTRALVTELIDAVVDDGACNFHAAVAEPLPSTVFLQLLGLPLARRDEFIALKDGIIRPPATTPDERTAMVNETGAEIYAALEEVVAARAEQREDDFVSAFLDAEVDGRQLSHEEVIDICYLFFLAGLDTVTASLDCMLAFLARHPEHRRRLVEDPEVIPHAVEELLRWETPVAGVARITAEATELSGCPIPAHQPVMVMLGSANTDERSWPAADEVDFDREVNKHLAFGGGVHRCLGSHLARMELRVVLEEWHARVPEYRLADGTELAYSQGLRQIDHLPLVW